MWKASWKEPPSCSADMYLWRVYCRVWKDAGLTAPGLWIIEWMKRDGDEVVFREAVMWYINNCNE